jgi:hypothetical protein
VLRENFRREIETVTPDMLVKTFHNMERRVQACLDANGEHFQHLLDFLMFLIDQGMSVSNFTKLRQLL